jgi:two-component system chemotaxis response regulator CheV
LLLFRLVGKQLYGINVFKVKEVIQCPPLTNIPRPHKAVRGIANMRGKTITIMDLSVSIGGPSLGDVTERFIVITEYNRQTQGLLVGSVDRIVNMNWEEILSPPKGVTEDSYMTAVTRVDGEMVEIVDVEKVLKEIVGGSETVSEGIVDESIREEVQHVLVVDDSNVARKQVKHVLDQLGVETTLCNNGQEALGQLRAWVDGGKNLNEWLPLIISDVEMPVMDGYTLTTEIRKDPELQHLHVVLHTSLSGVFNESMIKQVGADSFLAKYEPDDLATLVQERLIAHRGELAVDSQ